MKQIGKTRSRFKNLIYSSAVLAALSPSVEAKAQETEPVDTNVSIENMEADNFESMMKNVLVNNEDLVGQDLSLLRLMMTARELHLEGNYEQVTELYRFLSTYADLDEAVLKQIHTNETQALNEAEPVEWTLNDEQISKYETVIILTGDQTAELLTAPVTPELETAEQEVLVEEPVADAAEATAEPTEESVVETAAVTADQVVSREAAEPEVTEDESDAKETVVTISSSTEATDLYNKSMQSGSVTTAWYTALEGYSKYPEDERFKEAIEKAGVRSLNYADSLKERGNVEGALAYYGRTLDSPWLSAALTERAQNAHDRLHASISSSEEEKKEALYRASVDSGSVTTAWYKAIEGYTTYPDDARFKDAIEKAGVRSLDYADRLEDRGNLSGALAYFGRTLDSPWLSETLTERAQSAYDRLYALLNSEEEKQKEALYRASVDSGSVTTAWYKAIEGYTTYPDDARFKDAIEKAGVRSLDYADRLEDRGNYAGALAYYGRTLDSPWLSKTLTERTLTSQDRVEKKVAAEAEAKKQELYTASVTSGSVTTAWYKALEGYNTYPNDARFKDAIEKAGERSLDYADSLEARGNLNGALAYFDRTLDSPWLSAALKERAQTSKTRVLKAIEEEKKEALYKASVDSSSVSTAWYTALEGYNQYPDDARFKDAIEKAAIRSLDYADSLEAKGKASSAIPYYDRTLDAPWMTQALLDRAETSKARMLKVIEEINKTALYNASINASTVTEAWNKAVEGYTTYPTDTRFQDAIRKAAVRNLNYADTFEAKGNAAGSILYYDRVLNAPWLPNDLYTRAFNSKEEMLRLMDSDYVYQEILKEPNQIIAWEMAAKAVVDHPDDTRISDYITAQAENILDEAITLHKAYQYDRSVQRYDLLIHGPADLYDDEDIAEKYKILALNDLIPNHASYQNSYYFATLDEALDQQMRRAPQTQSGGSWVNASREQTEYYLNPANFLESIDTEAAAYKVTGEVTASALNVRSGNGTGYSAIDQVYAGQSVTIIDEDNGWYQIVYIVSGETRVGWVHGDYVQKDSKETVKHDFNEAYNPVARITATTLNVRQGPGTSHSIITTVNSGQRYTILKGESGWYQLDLGNGQLGWVSGDYVTVSNTLEKDLLQFLKLSVSSGIDEVKLNQEIGNSGVLTGKGHIFLEASQRYNINEIYLLAHAKLETGNGSSSLAQGIEVSEVDGVAVEPKVVYNMFGIAAFDSSPLKSGSEYAYKMGWDTVDKAIMGGAEWISKQYVNHATHKQDTLYKMRWNPLDPGAHQYATDIGWAYKQTHTLNTLVEVSQKYDLHLNFDIPVYNVTPK
ncbi:Beta-N-acetylglucosaminidase [Alkalibacterium subtropicum]|uniref:Beta-N-acetylglucosaminidase n=1 Tax=Alkalibacterium subtropicum TaxID=753702 RepID=A0A1I1GPK5_9LACT|nr:SH3 domain-containing protein [Alkalibacterium subtropicum]SFC11020.1 Beta-N-acetylglucosaminidase [Alkalibacterium subtropicum]